MKLTVRLGKNSYDIIIKRGGLKNLGQLVNLDRRVFVVTDSGVPAEYAQTVAGQCREGVVYTVPQGEASKSLRQYTAMVSAMLEAGMDRGDLVVAVGGGVVGDLAGFAAATYMRGIDFINCPTTTLAQIDASIGGKTAVDLGGTKNVVGAFWQPRLVVVDPDTLKTLPERHFVNGLAEAIKVSLTLDASLFQLIETSDVHEEIENIIYRSLLLKKRVVERDEREEGMRAVLNFGHTLGHGIEAVRGVSGRRKNGFYHGECVALGMLPMIEDRALQRRVRALFRRLGLPARVAYDREKVMESIRHDKKAHMGFITLIKVPGLGCWRMDRVPLETTEQLVLGK